MRLTKTGDRCLVAVDGGEYGSGDSLPAPWDDGRNAAEWVRESYASLAGEQVAMAERFCAEQGIELRADWPEQDAGDLLSEILERA